MIATISKPYTIRKRKVIKCRKVKHKRHNNLHHCLSKTTHKIICLIARILDILYRRKAGQSLMKITKKWRLLEKLTRGLNDVKISVIGTRTDIRSQESHNKLDF